MHWFLIVSLIGTNEVLVKELNTKAECLKLEKDFKKKIKNKDISEISCEQGELFETYDVGVKDEVL